MPFSDNKYRPSTTNCAKRDRVQRPLHEDLSWSINISTNEVRHVAVILTATPREVTSLSFHLRNLQWWLCLLHFYVSVRTLPDNISANTPKPSVLGLYTLLFNKNIGRKVHADVEQSL